MKREKKPEDERQKESLSSGEEDNDDESKENPKEGLEGVNSWGVMKNLLKFKKALKKTNPAMMGLVNGSGDGGKTSGSTSKRMTKFSLKSILGSATGLSSVKSNNMLFNALTKKSFTLAFCFKRFKPVGPRCGNSKNSC